MLVLSRRPMEKIRIGKDIVITLVRVGPNSARIAIEARREMNIVRCELEPSTNPSTNGNPE